MLLVSWQSTHSAKGQVAVLRGLKLSSQTRKMRPGKEKKSALEYHLRVSSSCISAMDSYRGVLCYLYLGNPLTQQKDK